MKFLKGMDISTLQEVESLGGRFYDHGVEKDVLDILKSYDVNAVRLRLWNDPYTEEGKPYGAGTNDLPTTIALHKVIEPLPVKCVIPAVIQMNNDRNFIVYRSDASDAGIQQPCQIVVIRHLPIRPEQSVCHFVAYLYQCGKRIFFPHRL